MPTKQTFRRQWRFYETAAGNKPVKEFLDALAPNLASEVVAAMKYVQDVGLAAAQLRGARHLLVASGRTAHRPGPLDRHRMRRVKPCYNQG